MSLTPAQREVLELTAAMGGEITRWDVDGSRLPTLTKLWVDGHLNNDGGGWYSITNKGREALQ